MGVGGGVAVHRSGSAGVERQRAREVLRVILIPMDSAQRVKEANLKKTNRVSPFVSGFLRSVNY